MSSQTQQGIFYNIFGLFEIKIKPLDMNSNIMCNKKQGIQHARISELLSSYFNCQCILEYRNNGCDSFFDGYDSILKVLPNR